MKQIFTICSLLLSSHLLQAQCWQTVVTGNAANHSLALKTDGTLRGWGGNDNGQVGNNSTTAQSTPDTVSSFSDWTVIAANGAHSMGIRNNGELWGWGLNTGGALGDGTFDNKIVPTRIGTATDWDTLSAGSSFMHAIKTDGTLWAWGYSGYNQLGIWAGLYVNTPVMVNSSTDWKSVSGGVFSAAALKTDGTLWQWGNGYYQGAPSGVPVQIGTDTDWKLMVHGSEHNLALKNNGSLWAWGNNLSGQLGDGTSGNYYTGLPKQIGTATDWTQLAAGGSFSLALKADGSLWAWGSNAYGQLGDGSNTYKLEPTQIGSATDWVAISAGSAYSIARKADGTVWVAGLNDQGQLGLGNTSNVNLFTQLNCESILPVSWLSFTASKQGNSSLLKWETASEQNAAYYIVERRNATGTFTQIATLPARGSSNTATAYSYQDAAPGKGVYFYRIRQVDLDGKFSFTEVRNLNFTADVAQSILIYPVPAINKISLTVPKELSGLLLTVQLHNSTGVQVMQQQLRAQNGGLLPDLQIAKLSKGVYHIKIATGQTSLTGTFVKQ